MQKPFELIYEGPVDDTSDTLRKVKAVFLAELNFSIEKTKEILEKAPLTVIRADEEVKITRFAQLLSSAGARVHIVVPESDESYEDDNLIDIDIKFVEPKKKQKIYSLTDDAMVEEVESVLEEEEIDDEYDISEINETLLQIPEIIDIQEESAKTEILTVVSNEVQSIKADNVEEEDTIIHPHIEEKSLGLSELNETINEIEKIQSIESSLQSSTDFGIAEEPTFELSLGKKEISIDTEEMLISKMSEAENNVTLSADFSFNDDPLADRFIIPENDSPQKEKNQSSGFDLSFSEEPVVIPDTKQEEAPKASKVISHEENWELSLGEVKAEAQKPMQVSTKPVTPPSELDALFNSYETEDKKETDSAFDFSKNQTVTSEDSIFVAEIPAPIVVQEEPEIIIKPNVISTPIKRKKSISLTPIFCLVGVIVLWGLNHLYFSMMKIEDETTTNVVSIKPKKAPLVVSVESLSFSKTSEKDGISLLATGDIQNGKIKNISITARNFIQNPLKIEKILFEDIPVESFDDGKFSLHGPARITVLEGKDATRVIGMGTVQGRLNNDSLSLSIEAKYQANATDKNDNYIKETESGFSISFSSSQVLR